MNSKLKTHKPRRLTLNKDAIRFLTGAELQEIAAGKLRMEPPTGGVSGGGGGGTGC
jgi:hypothetical protein